MTKRTCAAGVSLRADFADLTNKHRVPAADTTPVFKDAESFDRLRRIPIPRPRKSTASKTNSREANDTYAIAGADLAGEAIRIRRGLKKGADGIIEAALDLYRVKRLKLIKHGLFTRWIENKVGVNIRTGEWLINIASNPEITKPCQRHALPASIRTLYELSKLPRLELRRRIANGIINPGITREEAIVLRWEIQKEGARSIPERNAERLANQSLTPKPSPEIATMVDACMWVAGGDVVKTHISNQEQMKEVSLREYDRAAPRFRRQLAKRRSRKC
jgi:hypothetical protein